MGATSRAVRDSSPAGMRRRASGYSLVEIMMTLSVGGLVLAIAVPSFGRTIADIRTRSTAQQLAGALRLARVRAVTRSRPAAFMLTDPTPRTDGSAAVDGGNWLVEILPSTAPFEAVHGAEIVLAATQAPQDRVILTGPAQVCFDAQGLQMSAPAAQDAMSAACAQPGGDGATSYLVSRQGATRQYKVRVYRTGRVDICDTGKTHDKDLDGCR